MSVSKQLRIDRLLANNGYGSRKQVKQIIRAGRIKLDNQLVLDPGLLLREDQQQLITLDDQPVLIYNSPIFMLNKPSGYITALDDARHATIAELIPEQFKNLGLFPIGRLDKDTTGLLLLTNDGTLCHQLLSPQNHVAKIYELWTEGEPWTLDDAPVLANGLKLFDGTNCLPAELEIVSAYHVKLTIYEGKYHQVKKMAAALNHPVQKLHRLHFAGIELDPQLTSGELRILNDAEASIVRKQVDA